MYFLKESVNLGEVQLINLHVVSVCLGFLQALWFPPTVQRFGQQIWSAGYLKLPVNVNVSVNGCLSLCVSPSIDCQPVHGVPLILYKITWD